MNLQENLKRFHRDKFRAEEYRSLPHSGLAGQNESLDRALADLSAGDRALFRSFGAGPAVEPAHSCIHQAIEAQAKAAPRAIAARHLDDQITYGSLNRQAERLAAIKKGSPA